MATKKIIIQIQFNLSTLKFVVIVTFFYFFCKLFSFSLGAFSQRSSGYSAVTSRREGPRRSGVTAGSSPGVCGRPIPSHTCLHCLKCSAVGLRGPMSLKIELK